MNQITAIVEPAPAKLNLALHVRRRRPDGYHDIETLFAFCRDGDLVTLSDAAEDRFRITGPFAKALAAGASDSAPAPALDDNLVIRALHAFRACFGIDDRHDIMLEKNLPVASGIGGGSADAAATLRALARRHDIAADDPRLIEMAAGLGADVPACLSGRTAFGTGKGDALIPVNQWQDTPVLLVNPGVGVSTASVFGGWDGVDRGALDPKAPWEGRNDLEPPARAVAPVIADVVALLRAQPGVTLARMSGSGATCFALFERGEDRDRAYEGIGAAAPGWWQLATTLS
ncbi:MULTISPECIES: 4-(cytidine 5'-diphospho)-2-C-methyl-D-erythritol kinase [unclassified Sphingomonas]|uniref:4-(cytidine 5'-diphospho)-2-C-methyl-D-erythritol kinase n=1 Tax=unclassified Sphingomonas TaxID=196159 RepID=UPI001D0FD6F4|nr:MULTISPECIES: 4-(cytidine 5'-diphospho)-2-C-methyl-D-erythritol kinase [unclassified Sphingomonas]MCC2980221.1 4-(cytidine 5'-diphospho)-2-C-methyl-D-erythritol kinase [Sphingomonas sp. IC4-52]MCD2314972.1 4-(cytidine 5'-diphospho)-2-C-methyl-D-erythritol kinase [Sphingomonas sp. IC-11]